MPRVWAFVQANLEKQAAAIHAANERLLAQRRLQTYAVGDQVYHKINTAQSNRLQYKVKPRREGPYTVKRILSLATYEIEDPRTKETFITWAGHLYPSRLPAAASAAIRSAPSAFDAAPDSD